VDDHQRDNYGELRVGLAAERQIRWAAADLTGVLEEGRRRLDLSPLATVALGRCAGAAALLLRLAAKTPQRLSVDVRGDGPLRRVFVEAEEGGGLRGLVGEPRLGRQEEPGGRLALGPALGEGLLRVTREDGSGRAYTSQVKLVTGEIGTDVAHYLSQSEQRRSAVLLGVLAKPSGVGAAGGLIVEALPGAESSVVDEVEQRIYGLGSISRQLDAQGLIPTVEEVLGPLDPELTEVRPLAYRCHCSRERLLGHLLTLTAEQVEELADEESSLTAECAFCGALYGFTREELLAGVEPS
jgi:molecular chaperone Hsp33